MRKKTVLALAGVALALAALAAALRLATRPAAEGRRAPDFVDLAPRGAEAEMLGDGQLTKRRAIRSHVPSTLSWPLQVPPRGRLRTHLSFAPRTEAHLLGTTCRVAVEIVGAGGERSTVLAREVEPHLGWDPYEADLDGFSGRRVVLSLVVDCTSPEGKRTWEDAVRWSVPVVYGPRPPELRNVLLVTIDTLRADHLHAYGYPRETSPAIDALARRGLLFRRAETVQSATWPALTSLHTSLYPSAHGVVWNGHAPPEPLTTLAELLRSRGYSTSAFLTNMKRADHRGFSRLSISGDAEQHVEDAQVTDLAVEQMRDDRDRAFFIWLHLISPHAGYHPPPEWKAAFGGRGSTVSGAIDELVRIRESGQPLGEEDVAHVVDLYDAEIAYADSQVGRALDALRALDLEEETLVVLTSDHGEDLYEHNDYPFHSPSMYASSLEVPLILALPGVLPEGAATDHPASLVDLAPTILGLLDLPVPSALFQGKNLMPGRAMPAAPVRRHLFSETNGRIYGVRTEGRRLIVNPGGEPPGAPGGSYPIAPLELYVLEDDPGERHNVADADAESVARLGARIEEWRASDLRAELPTQALDDETREELRALGYLVE